jgi:curved DNA-binding protein CbpA
MTHYETLQVSPTASPEVITASWKALVRKYHPDTNRTVGAKPKMLALNEAYEVLSNPAKRKEYDKTLNTGANGFVRNGRQNGHQKRTPGSAYGPAYGNAYQKTPVPNSDPQGLLEQFIDHSISQGEFNMESLGSLLTKVNEVMLQKVMEQNPALAMLINAVGRK